MMPTMTREQFNNMEFEELLEWAYENIDYIWREDALIAFAKMKEED